jgi:hypothetical protein
LLVHKEAQDTQVMWGPKGCQDSLGKVCLPARRVVQLGLLAIKVPLEALELRVRASSDSRGIRGHRATKALLAKREM